MDMRPRSHAGNRQFLKVLSLAAAFLAFPSIAFGQTFTISTLAGNGSNGLGGDGGPANSALLSEPYGVAVDSAGNLYIAEFGNSTIRKVTGGVITTVVGNGTAGFTGDTGVATSAELSGPHGIAVDAAGNLYIADSANNVVRKVSSGVINTVAGNVTPGFSGDNGPATSAAAKLSHRCRRRLRRQPLHRGRTQPPRPQGFEWNDHHCCRQWKLRIQR